MNTKKEYLHIYARVSTDAQVEKGFSLKEQVELGKRKAKELNMLPIVYKDSGLSASNDDLSNRPEICRLLSEVRKGVAKNIFVFDQTRLSRNDNTQTLIYIDLKKHNIRLFTKDKEFDFKSLEDNLLYKLMGVLSDYDSSMRKRRFQMGNVQANRQGKFTKNIPPYGYKKDKNKFLVFDEEEKVVIEQIFDMYKSGSGTNQIANNLNKLGVPTKTQKVLKNGYVLKKGISNRKRNIHKIHNEWNPGTILSIIKNTVYYGKRKFKNGNDYEFTNCPAIITENEYNLLQSIKESNAINKRRVDKYFYLLKGLLQCECGNSMHGRIKPNRGEYTYRCNSKRNGKGCGARGINIYKLNDIIWFLVSFSDVFDNECKKEISNENIKEKINSYNERINSLEKEKHQIETLISKSTKHLIEENIDTNEYKKIKKEYQNQIVSINDEISFLIKKCSTLNQRNVDVVLQKSSMIKMLTATNKVLKLYDSTDENKMKEVQSILFNCIENIKVAWDSDLKLHNIEVLFSDMTIQQSSTNGKYDVSPLKSIELNEMLLTAVRNEYQINNVDLHLKKVG